MLAPEQFSQCVLSWFDQHGRKNLPWQKSSAYHVWLSEIMLQQTQVNTVIPYFQRFIDRFPEIKMLAEAPIDDVLVLWAGLGYYARARNLHRTAQIIQHQYHGQFPNDVNSLQDLPGIGRSTAGAILALAMDKHAAILDGNVKRVLTRFHAITEINQELWTLAERYTPQQRVGDYTQAVMDLGATVCTRSRPKCQQCPLQSYCVAYSTHTTHIYPISKAKKILPVRAVTTLIVFNTNNEILVEKRPPAGIWGGLWSLPECPVTADIQNWCVEHYGYKIKALETWPVLRHTFSHFHLDITPVTAEITQWQPRVMERDDRVWYNVDGAQTKGFAAPIKQLLEKIRKTL